MSCLIGSSLDLIQQKTAGEMVGDASNQEALRRILGLSLAGVGVGATTRALMSMKDLYARSLKKRKPPQHPAVVSVGVPEVQEEDPNGIAHLQASSLGQKFAGETATPGPPATSEGIHFPTDLTDAASGTTPSGDPTWLDFLLGRTRHDIFAKPWAIPAAMGAATGGIYAGYKGVGALSDALKDREKKKELEESKKDYRDALIEQYNPDSVAIKRGSIPSLAEDLNELTELVKLAAPLPAAGKQLQASSPWIISPNATAKDIHTSSIFGKPAPAGKLFALPPAFNDTVRGEDLGFRDIKRNLFDRGGRSGPDGSYPLPEDAGIKPYELMGGTGTAVPYQDEYRNEYHQGITRPSAEDKNPYSTPRNRALDTSRYYYNPHYEAGHQRNFNVGGGASSTIHPIEKSPNIPIGSREHWDMRDKLPAPPLSHEEIIQQRYNAKPLKGTGEIEANWGKKQSSYLGKIADSTLGNVGSTATGAYLALAGLLAGGTGLATYSWAKSRSPAERLAKAIKTREQLRWASRPPEIYAVTRPQPVKIKSTQPPMDEFGRASQEDEDDVRKIAAMYKP